MPYGIESQIQDNNVLMEGDDQMDQIEDEMIEDVEQLVYPDNEHWEETRSQDEERDPENIKIRKGSMDSLFSYMDHHINQTNRIKMTSKKYCVVLYGPPASGKSMARNIAAHWIKTQMHEEIDESEIVSTFIDTNVDEIVYKLETMDGIDVKEKLTRLSNHIINPLNDGSMTDHDKIKIAKREIDQLVKQSSSIYFSKRTDADIVSEMLRFVAAFLERNIYIEISSGNVDYIEHHILDFCKWYDYTPVIVYPFVKNVGILCDRMYKRAIIDGRYMSCDDAFQGLYGKMLGTFEAWDKIKHAVDKKSQNSLMLMYRADGFDKEMCDKITNNDFSGFDISFQELILEYMNKMNDMTDNYFRSNDFDTMTNFINESMVHYEI